MTMLDVMRKHASSWLIKVILGAIIVTFIFFFGYSSYRKGTGGGRVGAEGDIVAKVNGVPISEAEFEFFFERNFNEIKAQFTGKEIPDFARQIAQSRTLQQLIGREMLLSQADLLGIVVTDEELADIVREAQSPQTGEEFDPIAYRHEFLPYFRSRYGMGYEQFVRQDIRLNAFNKLFNSIDNTPLFDPTDKQTSWTFSEVVLNPKALAESKTIANEDEAAKISEKLVGSTPKEWQRILKSLNIEPKKIGPVTLAERNQLLGSKGTFEDYKAIFTLTKERSTLALPPTTDGKIYIVNLVERKEAESKRTPSHSPDFLEEWMSKLLAKAKIQNYLQQDKKQQ